MIVGSRSLWEKDIQSKLFLLTLSLVTCVFSKKKRRRRRGRRVKTIFISSDSLLLFPFLSFNLVASRRLAFLNKKGYDRFGKNKLFAPLMKWEAFKEEVETLRYNAVTYEDAYNMIKDTIERQDNLKAVFEALPLAAKTQVVKEKERLEEAKRIAISEKGAYVLVSCLF